MTESRGGCLRPSARYARFVERRSGLPLPPGGVMDLLSRRYAMQLVCVVGAIGPAQYGEIEETFGTVSSSTLSARLDELVGAGILAREQYAEIPPRVEYELTETGEELGRRLKHLLKWTVDEEGISAGQE